MYEKAVYHAIQDPAVKDFQTRYRMFKSEEERDRTLDAIVKHDGPRGLVPVTLVVIAETVNEQLTMEL